MEIHPIVKKINATYGNAFGGKHIVIRSPGRVNIIGEHTDYNEGFVLPAAIDKAAYVAVGKREDSLIKLYSEAYKETFETSVEKLLPTDKGWPNYIMGVADQMLKRGHKLSGFNLVLDADVPIGAGMSSSAAIECATAFGLNKIFNLNIPKVELALIAQKAEHTFAKVMCGIMDQFASMFGKKDHVIKLDCRSLEYEYEPFKLDGIGILLLNTNVEHSLAASEYNVRRAQCEEGVFLIQKAHPQVKSLRDTTLQMLKDQVLPVDKEIFTRCKYVVEENIRLLSGCEDLKKGDIKALGNKMYETHHGLSKEYNVSCKELDFLVDAVRQKETVLGARMMGGGFGGCTINLVKEEAIEGIINEISPAYLKHMGKELTAYVASVEKGTGEILNVEF
ncbi:MAG: galactokinase [Ferruginibacter sp.]